MHERGSKGLRAPPTQLTSSGKREDLKELRASRLAACGWRDDIKQRCRGERKFAQPERHASRASASSPHPPTAIHLEASSPTHANIIYHGA